MRVWDIHPKHLCRKHLLGEHRELHGLWNILTKHRGRGGYSHHPETIRWRGKLKALYNRHQVLVKEMKQRGYIDRTPLNKKMASGSARQGVYINTINEQKKILHGKPCECFIKRHKNLSKWQESTTILSLSLYEVQEKPGRSRQ